MRGSQWWSVDGLIHINKMRKGIEKGKVLVKDITSVIVYVRVREIEISIFELLSGVE